ncbi:MAG: hypothetical protein IPK26_05675 [Planctomycetes bacterium]|nr:hypothetical protein [Planctomycetota bacterium]
MSIAGQVPQPVWVGGLPGTSAQPTALRLELAAVADAGPIVAAQPFVGICETGRFARVLLGRLATGGGFDRHVAVKIQRDVVRVPGSGGQALFENAAIDAMWRREREQLRALSRRAAPGWLPLPGDDQLLPPMAFDRVTGRLFEVPSPSFLPLRLCRDDERLRAAGLEPWSSSAARYLWCPKDPDHTVFHTWSPTDGAQARAGIRIVRRHQLFADLLQAWRSLPPERRAAATERFPAATAVLADLEVAWPQAPDLEALAQRVFVLNFYDAHAFATELQDLHFDE